MLAVLGYCFLISKMSTKNKDLQSTDMPSLEGAGPRDQGSAGLQWAKSWRGSQRAGCWIAETNKQTKIKILGFTELSLVGDGRE